MHAMALGLAYTFFADAKTIGVTTLAHIPRLGGAMSPSRRRLVPPAVGMAFIAGALAVFVFIIYQGNYTVGSYNFGSVSFNGSGDGGIGVWLLTANRIRSNALETDWMRLGWLGFGAIFTLGLYALRYRFPGDCTASHRFCDFGIRCFAERYFVDFYCVAVQDIDFALWRS